MNRESRGINYRCFHVLRCACQKQHSSLVHYWIRLLVNLRNVDTRFLLGPQKLDDQFLVSFQRPLYHKTKTSIVWSKKNGTNENIFKIKEKIKFYTKSYLKKIKFISSIEKKDLNFLIRKNYYKDRILLFGDALHVIHPFVGQGFNMVLRDLISLENILLKKIGLGLDIGASDILSEFAKETKSGNFAFSISTDLLKNSFTIKNKYFKEVRNRILKQIDKNDFTKNIFFNIANKGFKF